ncbi:MAG: ATP-binding cassette domain-containing protein, partial [Rickettsiaceae bacterium]|nr:ATP-binding cassette domain-containing protein [Rickettsiaceae bacterium]
LISAIFILIFISIYTPVIYWLLNKQLMLESNFTSSKQNTMGIINDLIANISLIKIIGNIFIDFQMILEPAIKKSRKLDKLKRQFDAYYVDNADTIMVTCMSVGQIWLLSYLYQENYITVGDFAFATVLTFKIQFQLDNFLENLLFNINPSIAEIKSSYNFINQSLDIKNQKNSIAIKNVKGKIEYSNVSFRYNSHSKLIISDFNLTIKPGENCGIVGMSGAGKSTLIKCLLRYFDVNSGHIAIDGKDIKTISQKSLRESIALIPQDVSMLHRTIYENLQLANYNATTEQIIEACKQARIHEDIEQMEQGYDTVVGERGVKLSGGQRQRIAIARAILKNAPILILDEATSNLDSITEELIQDSINKLLNKKQSTVIAIAHRLSTLKSMDRIIVIDKGQIVEDGSHYSLINKDNGIYKKLWQIQVNKTVEHVN